MANCISRDGYIEIIFEYQGNNFLLSEFATQQGKIGQQCFCNKTAYFLLIKFEIIAQTQR